MEIVVFIGLILGVFGGFQTTTSAIRSFYKIQLDKIFADANSNIEQLKPSDTDEEQKISPLKHRDKMDTWNNMWKLGHAVPLFAFAIASVTLSIYCCYKWDELFAIDATINSHSYKWYIIIYTAITMVSFFFALFSLSRIMSNAERLKADCQTAIGSKFQSNDM